MICSKRCILEVITTIHLFIWACVPAMGQAAGNISRDDVLGTMKMASEFMVNKISYRGGYLWKYAEDLSEREGEAPARESQIMVYGGTAEMGNVFLDLFEATGDPDYLDYARKAADALVYGQLPAGGWHYLIDFDMGGLTQWYEEVASRFTKGMEEWRHYYGNATFDDNTTQGATEYLLRIYMKTLLPDYLLPLEKALGFILDSQYPNGGWPQRYPLRYEFVHDGLPDYTAMYTLNDNAMSRTISLLIEAYEQLGDERYLEAARRGGDFFMVSQGPSGQAGWAEQFDMQLQPCWARTHEPAGFMPRQTLNTIQTLEELYLYTGDRRYLRPIPPALDWMREAGLRIRDDGSTEFARYYEPGSNLPIQCDLLEERNEKGYDLYHYYAVDKKTYLETRARSSGTTHPVILQAQGQTIRYRMDRIKETYERIRNCPEEEREMLYDELYRPGQRTYRQPGTREITNIINAMNDDGAWIEDIQIWDYRPGNMIEGRKTIRGIDIRTYIRNMRRLMGYLKRT